MKKMSYVSAIDVVLNDGELTDEVRERLSDLKTSLEKRNSRKSGEPTKAQKENAALAEKIVAAMEPNRVYFTAEIGGLVPELEGATPQKISPLMKKLVEAHRVVGNKEKGKAVYRLATSEDTFSEDAE